MNKCDFSGMWFIVQKKNKHDDNLLTCIILIINKESSIVASYNKLIIFENYESNCLMYLLFLILKRRSFIRGEDNYS